MGNNINWYPGHMYKAKKEIQAQLKMIDVVIEVIDSRVPFSSHNTMLDELTKHKQKLIVFAKSDLVNLKELNKYQKYYEDEGYQTIAVNLKENNERKKLLAKIEEVSAEIKEKYRQKKINKTIRALIMGMPNVGKSTLINHLINKNKVKIGNKPGVTKQQQWVKISEYLEVLDSPGIMIPKVEHIEDGYNLVLASLIKEEVVPLDDVAIYLLNYLRDSHLEELISRYKLKKSEAYEIGDLYEEIGVSIGAILKGQEVDYERVTRTVINDYRKQKFGKLILDGQKRKID